VIRLPVLALLPLFFAPAPLAFAQSGTSCAPIMADAERLACYDDLFRTGELGGDLAVTFNSEQMIPARPTGRAPATMTVACAAGGLSIAFGFAGNTLSALGNDAGITTQVDLQAARSRTLPVNTSNTALFINKGNEAAAFLDALTGATNLTVRVTPANSRSLNVRFRVDTIVDDLAPVLAACE